MIRTEKATTVMNMKLSLMSWNKQTTFSKKIYLFKNYEIAIDKVKDLGDFVEIEYKGKEKNKTPEKITEEMIKFLKDLDCGKIYRNYVGYPFQRLFPKEVKEEEIK